MRDEYFKKHVFNVIERIREFREQSPLGFFNSPAEYIDTLEDYLKLFYEINSIPAPVINHFNDTKETFDLFKKKVEVLCDILLEKVKYDNDTTKDKEVTEAS